MSTSSHVSLDELRVACTLGPDVERPESVVGKHCPLSAHPTASREGRTLEVRFERGPGVHAELVSLASAEQECCSFVNWTVTEDDGHPVLLVLAEPDSPDDVASIAAMFGAP